MDVEALVQAMTPQIYERLRQATETGKWPDGSALSEQQKESSMQAVLLYQSKVLHSDEHMTVNADGELVHKSRQQLQKAFSSNQELSSKDNIARFKQDDF